MNPSRRSSAILKKNVLANGCENAILELKALSNAAGTLTLYLDEGNKGKHSTVFDWKGEAIKVEALRLDDYLENRFEKVDSVKIDVEGAEPMVLEGMWRTIESYPAIRLVVEFAPERVIAVGRQPKQYLEGFINKGFSIYNIDEAERQVVPQVRLEFSQRSREIHREFIRIYFCNAIQIEPSGQSGTVQPDKALVARRLGAAALAYLPPRRSRLHGIMVLVASMLMNSLRPARAPRPRMTSDGEPLEEEPGCSYCADLDSRLMISHRPATCWPPTRSVQAASPFSFHVPEMDKSSLHGCIDVCNDLGRVRKGDGSH